MDLYPDATPLTFPFYCELKEQAEISAAPVEPLEPAEPVEPVGSAEPVDQLIHLPDEVLEGLVESLKLEWTLQPGAPWVYQIDLPDQIQLQTLRMGLASSFTEFGELSSVVTFQIVAGATTVEDQADQTYEINFSVVNLQSLQSTDVTLTLFFTDVDTDVVVDFVEEAIKDGLDAEEDFDFSEAER